MSIDRRKGRCRMRIIIIGAVAAGTSAAAKASRNNKDAKIIMYEKDGFVSYSGCGLPYYIGGIVESVSELAPRDPAFFKNKYNVDIYTQHEVLSIHPNEKSVKVKNLSTGKVFKDTYDKLIISTGASPILPPIKGNKSSNVFTLRNIGDMNKIKAFVNSKNTKSAVIVGSGFVGLEVCENLSKLGIKVTIVERDGQVFPRFDKDMASHLQEELEKHGVRLLTGENAVEITERQVILESGKVVEGDMVILSTGVRPNVNLAKESGIEIGITGGIKVDSKMRTNISDIYACGDCTEQFHLVTGKAVYYPLGTTANKMGRIAGEIVTGGDLEFRGVLGTGIFRLFDLGVAQTGLTEKEALEQGYDVIVSHDKKPDKAKYMGGKPIYIKAVADKKSRRLLGVQIVGEEGVDKRVDVFATAITFGAKVDDLFHLDLAYSPPFSIAKDPVMYTGMILDNSMEKEN